MKLLLFLCASAFAFAACSSALSSGKDGDRKMDGVITAPDHHKVLFEDARVRVVELKIAPGDTVPLHTHQYPTINYVVKPSEFLSLDSDGTVRLDSRNLKKGNEEGAVFSIPAFPQLHSVKNIGSVTMHGIAVEMKD